MTVISIQQRLQDRCASIVRWRAVPAARSGGDPETEPAHRVGTLHPRRRARDAPLAPPPGPAQTARTLGLVWLAGGAAALALLLGWI